MTYCGVVDSVIVSYHREPGFEFQSTFSSNQAHLHGRALHWVHRHNWWKVTGKHRCNNSQIEKHFRLETGLLDLQKAQTFE